MPDVMGRLQAMDDDLFHRVFRRRGGAAFRNLMMLASRSADGPVFAVLFIGGLPSGAPAMRVAALQAALAFALELSIQKALKHLFKRHRPCMRFSNVAHLIPPPDVYSFPSGHTAGAFLTAVLLGYAAPVMAVPLTCWAFCVGYSRVYAGVHFPADVLAGIVLGVGSALVAMALV
jgi:undecaprenyl-diphosphatase